ncbi:MAG: protease modulator HflC [Clostridia bacterium]|nr:protease modulator HflC [Clostridia bacterium]
MNNEQVKQPKEKRSVSFTVFKYVIAVALVVLMAYFGFTTEVREGSCAVILRFGAVREEISDAGLYFRLPWPFETVVTYDNRLQYLESNYLETTTKDKRNVIIQSYVVWKINDPVKYHNSVGSQGKVDTYIKGQVFSATNSVMGAYELSALVSLEKEQIKTAQIQDEIFARVRDNCAKNYGIEVDDVSILRLSLPDTNLQSVFDQMRADRQKDIDTILANAQRDANKITSDADAQASQIIADGVTAAAAIKQQTETDVAKIYAEAQAANLELYQFLKQLDTVVASVNEGNVLVVKANEYPFSILSEYGSYLTDESDETIVKDLSHILSQLPEADRKALTDAIYELIAAAGTGDAS